jgi:hypothetical protein
MRRSLFKFQPRDLAEFEKKAAATSRREVAAAREVIYLGFAGGTASVN